MQVLQEGFRRQQLQSYSIKRHHCNKLNAEYGINYEAGFRANSTQAEFILM
jgi:hypothetical protein